MTPKTVLITGCSAGGIGSALAEAFQKRGMHVFATARDLSKMAHLRSLPHVTLLKLDPTSGPSVQTAVEDVKRQTGRTLDYLVNNAGQTIIMPTLDFDIDTAKSMYDINVWGMVRVMQAFAPLVIAAKGTIISISSIAPCVHTPWMGELYFKSFQGNHIANKLKRCLHGIKSSCNRNHRHASLGISTLRCQSRDSRHRSRQHQRALHRR